jgi:AraC-like DNA-binding protein
MRQSLTLGDAITASVELDRAFSSGERWWVERRGDDVQLCHGFDEPLDPADHQADHYGAALAITLVRLAAGPDWTPTDVEMHSAHSPEVLRSPLFDGTRVSFGHRVTKIAIPEPFLGLPFLSPAPRLLSLAELQEWKRSAPADDLRGSLQQVLASLAPRMGHVRIQATAAALGVSVRTLQRRLSDGGLCFEETVRDMRLQLAADLLTRTDSKVLDIALDLGYSDHAHFTRAFHRWTGLSPVEYRRHRRSEHRQPKAVSA